MPLKLDIAMNSRQAEQESKDLATALEKITAALERTGQSSSETDQLVASLRKIQAEADDAQREVKQVGDAAEKAGREGKAGLSKASEGFDTLKEEGRQTARETAASFGSIEDAAGAAQEAIANSLAGFGPEAAAAGIIIAAGLGAALQGFADAQEKLNEAREKAGELAQTLYQNKGVIPLQDRVTALLTTLSKEAKPGNGLLALVDTWVDFGSTLDAVKKSAALTGVGLTTMTRALRGDDLDTSQKTLDAVNEQIKELESNVSTAWAWNPDLMALRNARTEIEATIKSTQDGSAVAEAAQIQAATQTQTAADQQKSILEGQKTKIESLSTAWQNAAVDASSYFTTADDGTKTFDLDSYLADADRTIAALNDYKAKIVGLPSDIQAEAQGVFASSGAEAADAYINAYVGAQPDVKSQMVSAAQANSSAAGMAAAAELARTVPSSIPVSVDVQVNSTKWDQWTPQQKTSFVNANPAAAAVMRWDGR